MKRKYIQPEVKSHRLKVETVLAVVSNGRAGDYTGVPTYDGTKYEEPNINDKTQILEDDYSIIRLPGADE